MDKRLLSTLYIVIIVFIFVSSLSYFNIGNELNLKITDNLYGDKKPLEQIIILAIDDKSLQSIGRWPWKREVFVDLFSKLKDAEVVGIDIAFFESYNKNVDTQLGDSIHNLNNAVLPIEFTSYDFKGGELKGTDKLVPIDELTNKSDLAFINIFTDNDGISRKAPMKINEYKSFSYEISKLYLGREIQIPSDTLLINYAGSPGSFKTYSIVDFINGKLNLDLKDKIVLIGATSPDLHDDYLVPTSSGKPMPGVEIHANIVQTLLTKNFLTEQSKISLLIIILFLGLLIGLCLYRFKIWVTGLVVVVLYLLYLFFAVVLFNYGLILNFIYPFLMVLLTYLALVSYYYVKEQKHRKKVLNLFGKYVSKDVVNEILKSEHGLDLKGIEREVSLLFADIRGFTSMSEKLKPKEVVNVLNKCLTEMTDSVFDSRGTLDKYIGDCVMAIFGAPLEDNDHALHAVSAALSMVKKINSLGNGLKIGAGVNTGEAIIGNVGSKDRLDYTAIGDSVNLASRVESLNKYYGTNLIITETTYSKLGKHDFFIRELDNVMVKGKKKAITIYEVMIDENTKLLAEYTKALSLYKNKKFKDALKIFDNCYNKYKDQASFVYLNRCKGYVKNPPPKDWDGVTEMKDK